MTQNFWGLKKSAENYQTISQVKRPEEISVSANHWTSFSKFAFGSGGSIVIENEDYCIKDVLSMIALIHQTEIERK